MPSLYIYIYIYLPTRERGGEVDRHLLFTSMSFTLFLLVVFSSRVVGVAGAPTNAEEGVSGWMRGRGMSARVREHPLCPLEYESVQWCVVFLGCVVAGSFYGV